MSKRVKETKPVGGALVQTTQAGSLAPAMLVNRIRALAQGGTRGTMLGGRSALERHIRGPELQVVFFCDTTGSMYPYFERVCASIGQIVERLTREGVQGEFAVYAYKNHGDEGHFDGINPFAHQPFSRDPTQITATLAQVRPGGGGDGLCAIEDALHHLNAHALVQISGMKRVGIVIGDMPPHGVVDRVSHCPHEYDYRVEVTELHRQGFTFYSVFCAEEGELASARKQKIQQYYRWLAKETGGKYLDLTDIESLVDVLLGICLKETGRLDSFMAELSRRVALPATTRRLLLQLKAPGK